MHCSAVQDVHPAKAGRRLQPPSCCNTAQHSTARAEMRGFHSVDVLDPAPCCLLPGCSGHCLLLRTLCTAQDKMYCSGHCTAQDIVHCSGHCMLLRTLCVAQDTALLRTLCTAQDTALLRTLCTAQDTVHCSGHCTAQDTVRCSGHCALLRTLCTAQDTVHCSGQNVLLRTLCTVATHAATIHVSH